MEEALHVRDGAVKMEEALHVRDGAVKMEEALHVRDGAVKLEEALRVRDGAKRTADALTDELAEMHSLQRLLAVATQRASDAEGVADEARRALAATEHAGAALLQKHDAQLAQIAKLSDEKARLREREATLASSLKRAEDALAG
ncbi:hypothetical protein T484DRAFT_1839621, partial [Baffinella frigidus]